MSKRSNKKKTPARKKRHSFDNTRVFFCFSLFLFAWDEICSCWLYVVFNSWTFWSGNMICVWCFTKTLTSKRKTTETMTRYHWIPIATCCNTVKIPHRRSITETCPPKRRRDTPGQKALRHPGSARRHHRDSAQTWIHQWRTTNTPPRRHTAIDTPSWHRHHPKACETLNEVLCRGPLHRSRTSLLQRKAQRTLNEKTYRGPPAEIPTEILWSDFVKRPSKISAAFASSIETFFEISEEVLVLRSWKILEGDLVHLPCTSHELLRDLAQRLFSPFTWTFHGILLTSFVGPL